MRACPAKTREVGKGGLCRFSIRASLDATDDCGLLDGIADPSTAAFYSTDMNLKRAAEMVSQRDLIYRAAVRDADDEKEAVGHYLKRIQGKRQRATGCLCR